MSQKQLKRSPVTAADGRQWRFVLQYVFRCSDTITFHGNYTAIRQ